jgi:hypothetical protein
MGAWDVTAFGNDDAADWASSLVETPRPSEFVENTLRLANRDGYLEAPDGSQLVAAAVLVAAACGRGTHCFPEGLGEWLRGKEAALKHFAPAAVAAIRRVMGEQSELRDLWQDTEDFPAWCGELDAITTALR